MRLDSPVHSETIASPDTVPLRSCGLDPTLAAALGPLADVSPSTAVAEAVAALPRDLQRLLQVPGATTADIAALGAGHRSHHSL